MPSTHTAHLQSEEAAFAYLQARVWPNGAICPHCGESQRIYSVTSKPSAKAKVRFGLKKCGVCRKQFTVRVGSIFESSHVPLHIWLQAILLICSSRKDMSVKHLSRVLGVAFKTAAFMKQRIGHAVRSAELMPLGDQANGLKSDEPTSERPGCAEAITAIAPTREK